MGAMASARLIILGSMQLASAQMQVAGLLPSWFACVVAFGDRPRALLAWRLGSRFRKMQPAMRARIRLFFLVAHDQLCDVLSSPPDGNIADSVA